MQLTWLADLLSITDAHSGLRDKAKFKEFCVFSYSKWTYYSYFFTGPLGLGDAPSLLNNLKP